MKASTFYSILLREVSFSYETLYLLVDLYLLGGFSGNCWVLSDNLIHGIAFNTFTMTSSVLFLSISSVVFSAIFFYYRLSAAMYLIGLKMVRKMSVFWALRGLNNAFPFAGMTVSNSHSVRWYLSWFIAFLARLQLAERKPSITPNHSQLGKWKMENGKTVLKKQQTVENIAFKVAEKRMKKVSQWKIDR